MFFSFFFGKVFCDFEIFKKPSKKNNTKRNNILCFPGICFFCFFQFLDLFFFLQGFLRFWDFQKTYIARKTNKQIQWFPGFLIFGFVFHLFIFPLGPILNLFF